MAAATSRPRSTRRGSSKANLAYDLGHRGEPMPAWVEDNDDYLDAYEEGVSDRDGTGGADTGRPDRKKNTEPRHLSSVPSPDDDDLTETKPAASSTPADPVTDTGGRSSFMPSMPSVITSGGGVGSAILAAFAYAFAVNLINGTASQWLSAKWTNGRGSLP